VSTRLPTHLVVGALLRRVNDAGGMAVVLARGDAQTGGLLDSTPSGAIDDYWRRRRAGDPDLWVIELDIADGERFAAETILSD
jgi:hypothetical protein